MKPASIRIQGSAYDELAGEYYDSQRHPTCANFREASALLLNSTLERDEIENARLCEVGVGRSICVELLAKSGIVPNSVILVDSSSSMLEHSLQFRRQSVALMQADALSLPIQSAFIDVFVSVLGDSYNDSAFWREVARVLRAGGKGFFTTPSHEWSDAFRAATERDAAAFELRDGGKILIPSLIFDPDIQIKLIEATGLVITKVANVDARALRSPISPKLRIVDQGPIVTAYEFSKPR